MNFYPRKRRTPQVIIVSMIDIFAILLIFVIVTTTFKVPEAEQPAVTIKLPQSSTAAAVEKAAALTVISISTSDAGPQIRLGDAPVSLEELTVRIRELMGATPKPSFAMRADREISYGFLIEVLDALKEGGLQGNLSAFTERKK